MESGPKKAFVELVLQEAEKIDWIESAAPHEQAEFSLSVSTTDAVDL